MPHGASLKLVTVLPMQENKPEELLIGVRQHFIMQAHTKPDKMEISAEDGTALSFQPLAPLLDAFCRN